MGLIPLERPSQLRTDEATRVSAHNQQEGVSRCTQSAATGTPAARPLWSTQPMNASIRGVQDTPGNALVALSFRLGGTGPHTTRNARQHEVLARDYRRNSATHIRIARLRASQHKRGAAHVGRLMGCVARDEHVTFYQLAHYS